jgi:hypothetical protein
MNLFKMILQLLRRGLVWLFVGYWVCFLGYTIMHLLTGGPGAVVIWYRHISGVPFHSWSWSAFLAGQIGILAITLAMFFFGRRPSSRGISTTNKIEGATNPFPTPENKPTNLG